MNTLCPDLQNIVFQYERQLAYADVMQQLQHTYCAFAEAVREHLFLGLEEFQDIPKFYFLIRSWGPGMKKITLTLLYETRQVVMKL